MRFLSIGECMAELAPASMPGHFNLGFAGDTFNTAWFLARLKPESDVAYFTAAGVSGAFPTGVGSQRPVSWRMMQML